MTAVHIPRKQVLWSGGFDSTYLLVSQLKAGERVEAVYITQNLGWQKQAREIEARQRIVHALPPELRARLKVHQPDQLGQEVWARWYTLNADIQTQTGGCSAQTAMLAAMADQRGPLQAGIAKGDLVANDAVQRGLLLEHQVEMPLLNVSKAAMYETAKAEQWGHLLDLTWSCEAYNSMAAAQPCGVCLPCQGRIRPVDPLFLTPEMYLSFARIAAPEVSCVRATLFR